MKRNNAMQYSKNPIKTRIIAAITAAAILFSNTSVISFASEETESSSSYAVEEEIAQPTQEETTEKGGAAEEVIAQQENDTSEDDANAEVAEIPQEEAKADGTEEDVLPQHSAATDKSNDVNEQAEESVPENASLSNTFSTNILTKDEEETYYGLTATFGQQYEEETTLMAIERAIDEVNDSLSQNDDQDSMTAIYAFDILFEQEIDGADVKIALNKDVLDWIKSENADQDAKDAFLDDFQYKTKNRELVLIKDDDIINIPYKANAKTMSITFSTEKFGEFAFVELEEKETEVKQEKNDQDTKKEEDNESKEADAAQDDEFHADYDISELEDDFEAGETTTLKESNHGMLLKGSLMPFTLKNTTTQARSAMPQDTEPTPLPVTTDGISIEKATMRWLSCSTGSDTPAKFNDLNLIPADNTVPNQQWQLDFALSGKGTIDAGDVEIVIPAYIWKDRNGNEPGRLTLAIPEEPASNGDFAWKRVGDTYVITNIRKISAGSKYMIQGTFRMTYPDPNSDKPFTTTPSYLMTDIDSVDEDAEYQGISDWLYANILVITPTNGEELSATTNAIRATIDTHVEVTSCTKKSTSTYVQEIPSGIPADMLPNSPEDYYYVKWYIDGKANGNQPYTLTLREELTDEYDGILLGFTSGDNQIINTRDGSTDIYTGHVFNATKSTYVWTAYPKTSFPEPDTLYTVTNKVTAEVRGVDDQILTTMSSDANAYIRTPRPPITYHIDKVWEYNDGEYGTDLETILERRPDSLNVGIHGSGFSDNIDEEDNWHTEYTDTGYGSIYTDAWEYTSSRYWNKVLTSGSTSGPITYYPDGRCSYTTKYWRWVQRLKDYDPETHSWTFYNAYEEGTQGGSGRQFTQEYDKDATNHLNNQVRATTDRDLVLLRNGNDTTDITYTVDRTAYIMPYTAKQGGDYTNPDDLHQNTVRMEIVDHTEYFHGRKLDEEEYYFTFATLPNPSVRTFNGQDSGYGTRTPIAAQMWGKVEDEWVLFGEIDIDGQITAHNEATVSGSKIIFPEDTVRQTKLITKTNADVIYASYDVGLRIKPTDEVVAQVEEEFILTDYVMMTSRNVVDFDIYDDESNEKVNSASAADITYLHGRNYRMAVDLDKTTTFTQNNRVERYLRWKNTVTLNRVSTITSPSEFNYAVSEGMLADSDAGMFYDLLPAGMRVDESSIKAAKNVSIRNINIIENYKNSGRQLLMIKADLVDNVSKIEVPFGSDKYQDATYPAYQNQPAYGYEPSTITFDMTYSYDEAKNRGLTGLRNHAAYTADEDVFGDIKYWSGEKDIPNGENHKETLGEVREDVRALMTDLSPSTGPNTIYAGDDANITEVDFSALTNIVKHVSVTGSDSWSYGHDNEVNVPEGGKYSYRITLTSGTDTTTKDIIILDSLEAYTPIKVTDPGSSNIPVGKIISQREFDEKNELIEIQGGTAIQGEPAWSWKGYFRGIDVSEITSLGIDAKVYYSTVQGLDITHYNLAAEDGVVVDILADKSIWSIVPPEDPSLVTGIAIDCRKTIGGEDFELNEGEGLIAYVHMKAPTWYQQPDAFDEDYKDFLKNAHAFNNVYMDVTQVDEIGLTTHSYDNFDFTQVGIYGMDMKVKKLWDDENDNDRIRPENLEVELIADGTGTGRKLTLSEDENWEGLFDHVLEFNDDDERIEYTISESAEGYTQSYKKETDGSLTTITLTNKHELFKINYPFTKEWCSEEPEGWEIAIPRSIVVKLYADGVFTGKTKVVTPDNSGNWSGEFSDLQKMKNGTDIIYSVEEEYISPDWVVEYDENNIKNTYYPYGDLIVRKQVASSTPESKDNLFKFTISLKDKADEELIGEYAYTIFDESNETISSGVIKSGDEFELKEDWYIEVKDIPSGAKYTVEEENKAGYVLSSKENAAGSIVAGQPQEAAFTNTYNTQGSVSITGDKTLTGRDLTRNQFRFEIYEGERLIRTAANAANGTFNFGNFNYTNEDNGKEFIYTVKEVDRGRAGYTYDDTIYTVKVYPVDNGDGTMAVTKKVYKNDEEINAVEFHNEYHAEGEVALRAWKELKGRKLQNEEFEFELLDENGHILQTKKNAADGSIVFDAIQYNETDVGKTFYYVVREKAGDDETVNYTSELFGYSVYVMDNGNGTLSTTQSPIDAEGAFIPALVRVSYGGDDCTVDDTSLERFELDEDGNRIPSRNYRCTLLSIDDETGSYGVPNVGGSIVLGLGIGNDAQLQMDVVAYVTRRYVDNFESDFSFEAESEVFMVPNPDWEPTEGELPVFKNTLKDGSLSLQKTTENGGDPDQEFNFKIKLIGENIKNNELSFDFETYVQSEAYAVFDGENNTLTFFRDEQNKYADNQVDGLKTYYTGIETKNYNGNNVQWAGKNVEHVRFTNYIKPISTAGWFKDKRNLLDIEGIDKLDTSNVTTMLSMFRYCTSLTYLDLSTFDTSNVTSMASMFDYSDSLVTIDLSSFDTSSLINTIGMFRGCKNLKEVYVDEQNAIWDMSGVTTSGHMFHTCDSLPNYRYNQWEKNKATTGEGGYLLQKDADIDNITHANTNISIKKTFSNSLNVENGEAEVVLKKDEKITISDVPAGTAYQIYEETPDGWVLVEQRNASGEIKPLETSEAEFKNRYQPGTTSVQFNGSKFLDNRPATENSFSFELWEGDELIETVSTLDGGFIQFSVISYTEEGTHHYTIKEVNPNSDTIDYDTHVENVTVIVTDNGDGTMSSEVTYDIDGIIFRNNTRPGSLEIKKTAQTTNANKDDEFTFEIEFTNENGVPLSSDENIYWYKKDADGNIIKSKNLLMRGLAALTGNEELGLEKNKSEIRDIEAEEPKMNLLGNTRGGNEEDIVPWTEYTARNSSIKWKIDSEGILHIAAINGESGDIYPSDSGLFSGGKYANRSAPWLSYANIIKTVIIENSIRLHYYYRYYAYDYQTETVCMPLFYNMNAKIINISNLDFSELTSVRGFFGACYTDDDYTLDLSSLDFSNVVLITEMITCNSSLINNSFKNERLGVSEERTIAVIFPESLALPSLDFCAKASRTVRYGVNQCIFTGKFIDENGIRLSLDNYEPGKKYIRERINIVIDPNGGYIENTTRYTKYDWSGAINCEYPYDYRAYISLPSASECYKSGHKLLGFKTSPTASYIYSPGSNISSGKDGTVVYAIWEYDGKNQINVDHYQETTEGGEYTLVDTDIIRDTPGTEHLPELKSYPGFHAISSIETVVVDDEESVTVSYYYDRDRYTVKFDGNGNTSGQMLEAMSAVGGISSALPKNTYSKKGSVFVGWNTKADGSGTTYLDQAEILNIGEHGEEITLYAQWSDNNNIIVPTSGKILVTCKAGETIVIPDLPYGTKYTIKEVDLPSGWAFDSSTGEIGAINANEVSSSTFNNKYSAEGIAYITAHKRMIGDTPQNGQFTFELYQGNTLLQSKTNGDVDTNEELAGDDANIPNPWVGTAPVEFDALTFTQADIGKTFTYTIKEINAGDNRINYDTHTETVRITVSDAGGGNLNCAVTYDASGTLFTNSLKPGSLSLRKNIVNATGAAEESEFEFTIKLKDSQGNDLDGTYPVRIKHRDYGFNDYDIPAVKYSHTNNIDDTGKQNGNYANSLNTNDVITVPGAATLIADVYYNGESTSYDWLSVWKGNYPTYRASSNAKSTGYITTSDGASNNNNKFGGAQTGSYTVNGNTLTNMGYMKLTIPGDSVTFGFKSDGGGVGKGYGYYAVVTALDENGDVIETYVETREEGFTDTTISNNGTLTLKGSEELEITGLPDGAIYEIVETDKSGWTLTNSSGDTGNIVAGEPSFAEFENTYSTIGEFTPTATKDFIGGDLSEESFEFIITDENGNEISRTTSDENGDVVFDTIYYSQEDDGKTFAYYIKEIVDEDRDDIAWDGHISEFIVVVEDNGEGQLIATSTVTKNDSEFMNSKLYDIEVSKQVTGNMGDKTKQFVFTAEFYRPSSVQEQESIPSSATPYNLVEIPDGVEKVSDGAYRFTLADTERMVFENIPHGVKYNIIENDYSSEGYTTNVNGTSGREISGQITKEEEIVFKNDRDVAVPTRVPTTDKYVYWLIGVGTVVMATHVMLKRRRKKR